jgi:hypothetical protein
MATTTLAAQVVEERSAATAPGPLEHFFSRLTSGSPASWNLKTLGGLFALVVIWAAWMYGTWGAWGSLTIDTGREMYVPSVLAEGKTLYRDIWYLYGPLAPYWNSFLYRLFGVRLEVLYWAGSLSALGCAVFLYLAGMEFSAVLAGWTAGAAVLCQAFHPTLFSFPLPYSFGTVYGYLVSSAFLYTVICAATSGKRVWVFSAGIAAAAGLLLKLEVGAACYAALALLIAARGYQRRSWKEALKDIAVCLPGVVVSAAVIVWMVSLRGVDFITQENLMSWPSSYFMRTLGKAWLAHTGFAITVPALAEAAKRTLIFLALIQGLHLLLSRERPARNTVILRAALAVLALVYNFAYLDWFEQLSALFFPRDVVLYAVLAALAAWWFFLRRPDSDRSLALALAMTFAGLYAFRILLKTMVVEYPVFYNGPAIFCLLMLVRPLIPRTGRSPRFALVAEVIFCLGCLAVPVLRVPDLLAALPRPAWLNTERGSIRVSNGRAETYAAAIRFMKEKSALGESVLSVPEDTSLYFLSGAHCPTRVFAFTPGLVAPGRMTDEVIQEIEQGNVRYLLWSNRIFPEGGGPLFGVDFDQKIGIYLTSHYRRVGPVSPAPVTFGEWTAFVWERKPETGSR